MKNKLFLLVMLVATSWGYAQVGIGTSTPDASAALEISSTNKGFLTARMTNAERDAIVTPAAGLEIYSTDDNSFYYFDGTVWVAGAAGTDDQTLSYDATAQNLTIEDGNTVSLLLPNMDTATQDAIAAPVTGMQVYNTDLNVITYYDGSAWVAPTGADTGWLDETTVVIVAPLLPRNDSWSFKYRKIGNRVYIEGLLDTTADMDHWTLLFTMPDGFRPISNIMIPLRTGAQYNVNLLKPATIRYYPGGTCYLSDASVATGSWISFKTSYLVD